MHNRSKETNADLAVKESSIKEKMAKQEITEMLERAGV